MGKPVILVVRDPDFENDIRVYDDTGDVTDRFKVVDVDLGRGDLSAPDEFEEWEETMTETISDLPDTHPAARRVVAIINFERETHEHD